LSSDFCLNSSYLRNSDHSNFLNLDFIIPASFVDAAHKLIFQGLRNIYGPPQIEANHII